MSMVDSSSDDDCYVNSAKALKAMRKKLVVTASPPKPIPKPPPSPEHVVIINEPEDCVDEAPLASRTRSACRRAGQNSQRTETRKNLNKKKVAQKVVQQETPIDSISLLDSDPEDTTSIIIPDDQDQDAAGDDVDENYEMTIKINWQSTRLERVSLRRYQEFSKVFEYFSTMANVSQERIWLVLRNQITVQPSDTPDSLGLSIVDIIEGGIIDGNTEHNVVSTNVDKDSINIKIQTKDQKKSLNLYIKKGQKIKVLIMKCAEQLKISEDKVKLQFDGEPVHPNETPESLDLEGGECFDMHIAP